MYVYSMLRIIFSIRVFSFRFRRVSLNSVCIVLDTSEVCNVMDIAGEVCKVPGYIGDAAEAVAKAILELLNKLLDFIRVGVNADLGFNASFNSSKSASTIVSQVKADIVGRTSWMLVFSTIFSQIMALSILYLLVKSSMYLKKYLTKETYDNIYITHYFYKYDAKRGKLGKTTVLPLTSREKKKYIDTTVRWPHQKEIVSLQKGVAVYVKPLIITLCVIGVDYILYYLLLLINKYSAQIIKISGPPRITTQVLGSGIIAEYMKILSEGVNLNDTYSSSLNITYCNPKPTHPDLGISVLIAFLYLLMFSFIVLEAFGLRLRRKIASSFYPESEFDRVRFLHAQIIHKRANIFTWLKQYLPFTKKTDVSEHISLSAMFFYRCPKLAAFFGCCNPEKIECMVCFKEDDGTTIFRKCAGSGCKGVFCRDCFTKANKNCMVCKGSKFKDN